MALPMGELSAKLTERALLSPLRGHLSHRERQRRLRRQCDKFPFIVSMDSQPISIFGIFSIAVSLPSHKPEREKAVIAERCHDPQ